jgi:O-antigen/teichoic acid export membrane protein
MSERYGGQRFKRGLWHFALGKIVSAVSGFFAMVLVIRLLSIQEFANYSVLISLIEVTTALSGLGLAHALLRYVPELYVKHYKTALRQFVLGAFSLRTFILLLVAGVIQSWSTSFFCCWSFFGQHAILRHRY